MKGKKAMTPTERVQEFRKQRLNDGWKQVNVWLSPAAQLALSETEKRLKAKGVQKTQNEMILDAILRRKAV